MSTPDDQPETNISTSDGVIHIKDFCETDANTVQLLSTANNANQTLHDILRVGAAALTVSTTTIHAELVDEKFASMAQGMEKIIASGTNEFSSAMTQLVDPDDGTLARILEDTANYILKTFGEAFNPDSASSVMAEFNTNLKTSLSQQYERIQKLLGDGPDGVTATMVTEFHKGLKDLSDDISKLDKSIGERQAVDAALLNTPVKGIKFEDGLIPVVTRIMNPLCARVEGVGNFSGIDGKTGDIVVTLDPGPHSCSNASFVIEAKTKSMSTRSIHDELDKAMLNRAASAALAVFDSQHAAPGDMPFFFHDKQAIVVFDGEDDVALRTGLMWAAWVAKRDAEQIDTTKLDVEQITAIFASIGRDVDRFSKIRGHFTTQENSIRRARSEIDGIEEGITSRLNELNVLFESAQI